MKICLNRATAGGILPLDQFVALAAKSGFAGADVDLNYAVEKSSAALGDLYASHKQAFGGWGAPDWRNEEHKLTDALPNFRKSARIARELGIDSCATWIMPSSDRAFLENFQFHAARLKTVANVLAEHGLRLGLEFVAPWHLRRKFKHEFIFTPGLMLELADVAGPNVGLLIDAFHCHTSGTPFEEIAKLPREKIVLGHFNDAPKLPLHQVEDGHRLLPGDGAIDLPAFFSALKQTGYDGPVSLEIFNAELRAMAPEQAAAKAGLAAKKVLAPLGLL
jgi:sugar phosphate isomerase/epimerase